VVTLSHQATRCFRAPFSAVGFHPQPENREESVLSVVDPRQTTSESRAAKASVLTITTGPGLAGIAGSSGHGPKAHHAFTGLVLVIGPLDTPNRLKAWISASSGLRWPIATAAAPRLQTQAHAHPVPQILDRPASPGPAAAAVLPHLAAVGGAARFPWALSSDRGASGLASASEQRRAGYNVHGNGGRGTSCFSEIRLQAEIKAAGPHRCWPAPTRSLAVAAADALLIDRAQLIHTGHRRAW